MTEEIIDECFGSAAETIETSHKKAVAELRSKLEFAKSSALKKIEL